MKVLTCSSYDYMKHMLLELQQQLRELEEAETSDAAALANGEEGQLPRPPPRARTNPFDDASEKRGGREMRKRPSWASYHGRVGRRIAADRAAWCEARGDQHRPPGAALLVSVD